jgi:DNA-binding NarL/FixJ family response regulator
MHHNLTVDFRIISAADGEEALALLEPAAAPGSRPDIVLTDVMLPAMDGTELYRRVKADPRFRNLPFIFISASASETSRLEALAAGALDYIVKPVQFAELKLKIANLLSLHADTLAAYKEDLLKRIHRAVADDQPVPLTADRPSTANFTVFGITKREAEIIALIKPGLQDKEIADRLHISRRTVENHIRNIFKKTKVGNRRELIELIYSPDSTNG